MKTLSELSRELKDYLLDIQADAHNTTNIRSYRYNNLKIGVSDPRQSPVPQIIIAIGMSEAMFNLNTGEKTSGGLGPDERYVIRWFDRGSNREELKEIYKNAEKHVGKANYEPE